MDAGAYTLIFAAAEIARNENVDADGDTHEGVDEEVDERRRCADCGKRRRPGKFSDDNHVRRIEQQLQNARRRQWKRKTGGPSAKKRALDHIDLFNGSCHLMAVPSFILS